MHSPFTVIDLFSGAGGMSYGFKKNKSFHLIVAFDAEKGKPSNGDTLDCNSTYKRNMGFEPFKVDLMKIKGNDFLGLVNDSVDVFIACPPCTGFSRTNPNNHLVDDIRNNLVVKSAELALLVKPSVILMENARELIQGNFAHHYDEFRHILSANGYNIIGKNYFLNKFGLPQIRERSLYSSKERI